MGNHDFHPLNYYNTNEPNQEEISMIANFWSVFIGEDPAAMQEFQFHGYYRYDLPPSL
jgi:hypothetical protein